MFPSPNPSIAVSHSNGSLSVHQLTDTSLTQTSAWTAHEFETWITAYDYHQPSLLYSGADDCMFRGWDLRNVNRNMRSAIMTNDR